MLKLRSIHLGCSGERYWTAPVYFSVKRRNTNPVSYIFFLFDVLQFMYKIQTAWFLCRNASSKCGDNCVKPFCLTAAYQDGSGQCFCLALRPKHEFIALQYCVTEHSLCLERSTFISWAWLLLLSREKMFTEDFPWMWRPVSACLLSWKIRFTRQITAVG